MSSSSPNDPELDALLGAYALDALESSEREDVDAYLAENARARFEVDELRESAAALAMAPVDDATAPPELWERIARTIDTEAAGDTGPGADLSDDDLAARRAEHSDRRGYWMSLVAAAAAIVALALVAQVISLSRRLDSEHGAGEKATVAAFDRAQHATGARQVSLTAAHGAEVARVVLLPDGSGYLKNDGMTRLGKAYTYQLWALTGSRARPVAISAGVLGPDPAAAAFRASTDVRGFVLTVEHAGGVAQSTQPPYASATM